MVEIKANTKQIKEIGEGILKESREIKEIIEDLYTKLYTLQDRHIWLGVSAQKYLEKIAGDKEELLNFNNSLNLFGKNILNMGTSLEATANKLRGKL